MFSVRSLITVSKAFVPISSRISLVLFGMGRRPLGMWSTCNGTVSEPSERIEKGCGGPPLAAIIRVLADAARHRSRSLQYLPNSRKKPKFEGWQKFLIQTLSGRRITSLQKRKQKKQLQHQQTNVELLASPSRDETRTCSHSRTTHMLHSRSTILIITLRTRIGCTAFARARTHSLSCTKDTVAGTPPHLPEERQALACAVSLPPLHGSAPPTLLRVAASAVPIQIYLPRPRRRRRAPP